MLDQPALGRVFREMSEPLRKILVLGAISICRGMELLRSGAFDKEFELIETTHNSQMSIMQALRECDGVVLRPTQSPPLTREVLTALPRPIPIATLSRGIEHIELPPTWPKDSIISATGEAALQSARAVAELTLSLALALLRRFFEVMQSVRNYQFNNALFPNTQNLQGFTWVIIGRGKHVQSLLPLLLVHGVKRCIIWSRNLDDRSFAECLGNLVTREPRSMRALCHWAGFEMEVIGVRDKENGLYPALRQANVVSLHASSTTPEYHNLVNRDFLQHMSSGAVLINTARGVLVDEDTLVEALENKKIAGYAADVINRKAESTGDPRYSPIWRLAIAAPQDASPVYLTSHVGGSIRSVQDAISEMVILEFLVRLGVRVPKPDTLKRPLKLKGIIYDQE